MHKYQQRINGHKVSFYWSEQTGAGNIRIGTRTWFFHAGSLDTARILIENLWMNPESFQESSPETS